MPRCGSSQCAREILLIGTPLMWWAFIPALLWLAWHGLTTRDWRAAGSGCLRGRLAGVVPDLKRTMFLVLHDPLVPFLILGVTLGLGSMLGPAVHQTRTSPPTRRRPPAALGALAVATYLVGQSRLRLDVAGCSPRPAHPGRVARPYVVSVLDLSGARASVEVVDATESLKGPRCPWQPSCARPNSNRDRSIHPQRALSKLHGDEDTAKALHAWRPRLPGIRQDGAQNNS